MEQMIFELNVEELDTIYGGEEVVVYSLDEHGNVVFKTISV
nr:hypothetical protein [uncultured Bacteroides sp.]